MLKLNWTRHREADSPRGTKSVSRVSAPPAPEPVRSLPSRQVGPPTEHSPAIGVLGAKGGVGATTLAINLSYALAQCYGSTTILDANLQQPDVAVLLSREPGYSLLDLLPRLAELDENMLAGVAINLDAGASGLTLLSPPVSGEAVGRASLTDVAQLLVQARPFSQSWVVDLPRSLDRHLVTLLDQLSLTVLVFEPTLASVAAARRWLTVLDELGYPDDRVICVLNRAGGRLRSVERQLDDGFARRSVHKLPNAYELSEACSMDGEPAVVRHPRDPYSRAVVDLAVQLKRSAGRVGTGLTERGQSADA